MNFKLSHLSNSRWTFRILVSFACFLLAQTNLISQNAEAIAREWISKTATKYQLSDEDVKEFLITAEHVSNTSNIHHIYCRQAYQGIGVLGAEWNLHLSKDGTLLLDHSYFSKDLKAKISNSSRDLTAIKAVERAAQELGYSVEKPIEIKESPRGTDQKQVLSDGGVSLENIPAQLVYQANAEGQYRLAWELYIFDLNQRDLWQITVDAKTDKVLQKTNLTIECNTGESCSNTHHAHHHQHEALLAGIPSSNTGNAALANTGDTYGVYAIPLESPYYGAQSTVCDPADAAASPNGWHDRDGAPGPDVFVTDGNNAYAYYAGSGPMFGYSPSGGAGLDFVFAHDPNDPDPFAYADASLTNLFYMNNILHDVLHHVGFDEASGNFQNHNYTGLGVDTDVVKAKGFTSTWCNATMGTPPDGISPTMSMYICNSGGLRDGNFDNLVVSHEFGHGISKRLVGGAGTTSVLFNQEQMGEGWSDWYGLMLALGPNDTPTMSRGVGTYLFNQGAGGAGIRPFPYSTDKTINPHTYLDISGVSVPHGVGSVWCAMLWEMTWGLIDEYGYDANFYTGTGGNNIAMKLVTEALKLTPNSPGFEDGRDAILAADVALYGGANQCIIWRAFAKRGMGLSADQGSPNSRSDGSEAFDVPADCDCAPDYQFKTIANDDQASDLYGYDVDIQGKIAVVGAPYEDAGGSNAGAVYVYLKTGANNWTEVQKIVANDAAANDQFGRSVAIGRGFLIIGAPYDDDLGSNSGSAYIYKYDFGTGTYNFAQKITAWDGASNDYFGISVSMYSRVALIGASGEDDNGSSAGAAYTFRYNGNFWNGSQKLLASDGASGDGFGVSVDVWRYNLVVGASGDDDNGQATGAAYVFSQPNSNSAYTQADKLLASDGDDYDYFGSSVAINEDNVIVGAFQRESANGGKAYIYTNQSGTSNWPEIQILIPDDNAPGDYFGWDVAITNDRAVIGARAEDNTNGTNAGSAYVYDYYAGYWCMTHKLLANDGVSNDGFGRAVANDPDFIMVGAPYNDDGGSNSGSAYFFTCEEPDPFRNAKVEEVSAKEELTTPDFGVELFPNPNPGENLELRLSGLDAELQTLRIRLVDVTGKVVFQDQWNADLSNSTHRIALPQGLSKGFYLVTLESEHKQVVQKLVIE